MSKEEMDFTPKEWLIGGVELITKILLGLIAWLGVQLMDDMDIMKNASADLLNRVIEMNVKMDNYNDRISHNEDEVKELRKMYYEMKISKNER